jgi:hypothetical protein
VAIAFLCGVAILVAMRSSDRRRLEEHELAGVP